MTKQLEQLAVFLVLGVTAFMVWRAWRAGLSLGKTGNLIGARAADLPTDKAQFVSALRPKADDLIDAIQGGAAAVSNPTNIDQYAAP